MGDIEAHKGIYQDVVVTNLPPNVVVIKNDFWTQTWNVLLEYKEAIL